MIQTLTKIAGIQNRILEIDCQARQCLTMVCTLWALLTLGAAYSAFLSIRFALLHHSIWVVYPIAIVAGLSILVVLYILYRKTICLALFPTNTHTLGIICCELLICFITTVAWLPNMLRNLVGDFTVGFSLSDIISLNHAAFSFMLLCMALLLIVNVISAYALSISCKWHRIISNTVYSI